MKGVSQGLYYYYDNLVNHKWSKLLKKVNLPVDF